MIQLTIMSPVRREQVVATWIDLATKEGNMIIMPHHAEYTVQLASNQQLSLGLPSGAVTSIFIPNGIFHIKHNQAAVILDG